MTAKWTTKRVSTWVARLCTVAALLGGGTVRAQANAGVSDERVTLPQAPGSISGVGENAGVEGNQGALTYTINIETPPGFAGVTPQVALSYSSTAGSSVVGMGWSMPTFSIERMTVKGLQRYTTDDHFAVEGSDELVRVADSGGNATYRARFERGFVRYTWVNHGTGDAGYWKAEYPDGRVAYYGADATGAAVPNAQVIVPATTNVFRWHLVTMVDVWSHAMNFNYTKDATGYPLLERIDYLYDTGKPRHSVRFSYEARPDIISDARPGFELKLTQRLADVRVFSGTSNAEQVRKYVVAHESAAISAGTSRVSSVARFGRGDVAYPVKFSFGYSQTLGGACDTNCDKPFVRDMGVVGGVDFTTGRATLLDINGDALPDVLFSDAQGRHQFFYAKWDSEGKTSFVTTPVSSTKTTGSSPFLLGDPKVQVIDVNGDGFVDISQAKVPALLCNNGSGDWVDATFCSGASAPSLPGAFTPEDDTGDNTQQSPKYVRFFDYDNDKRIDWLRTLAGGTTTEVLVNTPAGFVATPVDNIGAVFDDSPLQLADMNGDGLQDPVQLIISGQTVQVQYKLNLGLGKWSDWRTVTLSGLDATQASVAEIEDINGDGLADIIAVTGNEVRLSLNKNGDTFAPIMLINSASLGSGMVPTRTDTTVVSYADMNGNGSSDIVFIQANGSISYLELFPVRPNLMSRIDNGIGAVQLITYGTSISEQGRDALAGKPWPNRVPNATSLVTRVDSFVTLTGSDSGGLREIVTYRYHSGYYDGVEKQFRGYENLEREYSSDMSRDAQEPGVFVLDYDVGKTNPAFAGLLTKTSSFAGLAGSLVPLHEDSSLHDVCPVAEVGAASSAITFVCEKASTSVVIERDAAKALTTRIERDYDGYGNVTKERNLGVVNMGTPTSPTACAPCMASGVFGAACGADCTGDERYTEEEFITPGTATSNAWILNKPKRVASGAVATSLPVETLYYYDGPDFVGLPAGTLTRGGITRVTQRTGPGANDLITSNRFRRDANGNAVEKIEPNGSVGNTASYRRSYTYDASGLNAVSAELKLTDAAGAVTSLKRDMTFEPAFELMSQSSNWYAIAGGAPVTPPQLTSYRYDEHARLLLVLEPGDTDATASKEFKYLLADPASKVLTLQRSSATSGQDIQTASCFDGRGRLYQTRSQISSGQWQVSGFTEYDARGAKARVYQPYVATSGDCEPKAPTGVKFITLRYDPLGRLTRTTDVDGSIESTEYGPLVRRKFDEDANDPNSPSANAPIVETFDGLNRVVSVTRTGAGQLASATTTAQYDETGEMNVVRDPAGNLHSQTYDAVGRLLKVVDTNSGTTSYEYDEAGNQVKETDARGKVTRTAFDGVNRIIARWDEADEAGTKVTYKYDRADGCTECTNGGDELVEVKWPGSSTPGVDRFGFDARGRETYAERTLDGHTFITRRKYDLVDRITTEVYPGDISFASTYGGDSRVLGLTNYVDKVEYDPRGPVSAITFSNGAKTTYSYDDKLQLSSHKATAKDGSAFVDVSLTRSKRGDILTLVDAADQATGAHRSANYTYDAWHRVTSAALPSAGGDTETLTFTFDAIDNILSQSSSLGSKSSANLGTYEYDSKRPNAVVKAGTLTYTYDEAGASLTRGDVSFTRDYRGRIVSANRGGAEVGHFSYGSGVERVVKQEGDSVTYTLGDDVELRDGIVSAWATLGNTKGSMRVARVQSDSLASVVLSDLAPATASGTQLTPTGDRTIDIADAWLAQAASAGAVQLSGGPTPSSTKALLMSSARRLLMNDVTYLHNDVLHSVVAATDADGKLVAQQSFYPTGAVRSSTGYVDEHGFTGQQKDDSTGLLHFAYRDLDPSSGRWASVDPAFTELNALSLEYLGEATGGYAYVGNDFSDNIDPTGLKSEKTNGNKGNKNKNKKQPSKKGERAVRGIQFATALASLALSLTSAIMASQADATVDASGHVNLDASGKIAGTLSIAATSVGGVGSLTGATYDLKNAAKSKGKSNGKGKSLKNKDVELPKTKAERRADRKAAKDTNAANNTNVLKTTLAELPPPPPGIRSSVGADDLKVTK